MTGPQDDWLSESDLDALVDAGQIAPAAQSPVAALASQVVAQLERTLGGLGATLSDAAWNADVAALEAVRGRVDRLAYAPDAMALPAFDALLGELERAGQVDFVVRLQSWCSEVDQQLGERR
ncbi:MAG: hypothetical protein AAGA48_34965 [Myxococcota bacterium]